MDRKDEWRFFLKEQVSESDEECMIYASINSTFLQT